MLFIAITTQSVKIYFMKSVLVYIFMMTLLIPSANVQGVAIDEESAHSIMHSTHEDQTGASDCHEIQPLAIENNHDCCDEKSQQNMTHECKNDCNNCAEDISSNTSAILSGKIFFGSPLNSKIIPNRYHLPFPPSTKAFIPPIR